MRSIAILFFSGLVGCAGAPCEGDACEEVVEVGDGKSDSRFSGTFPVLKNELRPFRTDGCSVFPDGSWRHCCKRHDLAYWAGGTEDDRKAADQALRVCVEETGNADTARTMYLGVRGFGGPDQTARYRWGYGWKYNRSYKPLDDEQRALVASMSPPAADDVPIDRPDYDVDPYPTVTGDYCTDEAYYGLRAMLSPDALAALRKLDAALVIARPQVRMTTNLCEGSLTARLSGLVQNDLEACTRPRYTDEQPTHYLVSIAAGGDCARLLR